MSNLSKFSNFFIIGITIYTKFYRFVAVVIHLYNPTSSPQHFQDCYWILSELESTRTDYYFSLYPLQNRQAIFLHNKLFFRIYPTDSDLVPSDSLNAIISWRFAPKLLPLVKIGY